MSQFDVYKIKTKSADWRGICSLHRIDYDSFWTKQEFDSLVKLLKLDETVFGFTAGTVQVTVSGKTSSLGKNSWLVVLTDMRLLLISALSQKEPVKSKSIDIQKISGMIASQNKALGQLVVVSNGGIVSIENAMVNTTKNLENLFNKIKDFVKPPETMKTKEISPNTETLNSQKQSVQKTDRTKTSARKEPAVNPFADEFEELDVPRTEGINASIVLVVALLFGRIGIHDFIWGRTVFGIEKVALAISMLITAYKGLYVLSSIIALALSIWVLVDVLRIISGRFFHGCLFATPHHILKGIVTVLSCLAVLSSGYDVCSEIYDSSLKDFGGHTNWYDIIDAYNNRSIATKNRFERRRFSIIAEVGSVQKTLLGNYQVTLGGPERIPHNFSNEVSDMQLVFPHMQAEALEKLKAGDRFAASCIGRGVSFGTYTAEKCILKHVVQSR